MEVVFDLRVACIFVFYHDHYSVPRVLTFLWHAGQVKQLSWSNAWLQKWTVHF